MLSKNFIEQDDAIGLSGYYKDNTIIDLIDYYSQIEKEIYNAEKNGNLKIGDKIDLEMTLSIKNFNSKKSIIGKILID